MDSVSRAARLTIPAKSECRSATAQHLTAGRVERIRFQAGVVTRNPTRNPLGHVAATRRGEMERGYAHRNDSLPLQILGPLRLLRDDTVPDAGSIADDDQEVHVFR